MRLTGVHLENFGPFFQKHDLPLQVTRSAPVVLIHGENMRGKTSLLNAIRWCLYGTAQGRGGRGKETHRLISYDAIEENDYHMSVILDFEHDKHSYRLERHVQGRVRPLSDDDLMPTLHLKRDGHFVPEGQVQEIIGNILHKDISRFFLFDGEMLDQFEVLLFTAGHAAELVKDSIEQILGLPALHLGAKDLEALHRAAESRQLKAVQQTKKNEARVAQAQQVQSGIDAIEKDLVDLRSKRQGLEAKKGELQERRDQFGEIQADVREIEQLEETVDRLTKSITSGREDCKGLLGEAWFEIVAPQVSLLVESMEKDVQREAQVLEGAATKNARISLLREAIENKVCPVCGARHEQPRIKELKSELETLSKISSGDGSGARPMSTVHGRIVQLRPFTTRERLVVFAEKVRNIKVNEIELHKTERQCEQIKARIRGHDRAEIQKTEVEYERTVTVLAKLVSDIADRERELVIQTDNLSRVQQEIARLPEADQRIASEAGIYALTRDTFRGAIDGFRERLRKDVEKEATEIFRALTTERNYRGLEINSQFGLSIVDDRGRSITERSAGADQIVALSLIGALNRCATREGPIVMDTPFGRLDLKHRENILRFVPQLAHQVILLVQSGEFDRERDLAYVRDKIALEYRIVRDGRPTKSRFEQVK